MKRVALACLVGSAIEFYDFLIYGTAAALVFPTVFFPHLDPTVAAVASMGTFAVAFLSRPFGAAVFGYFGDRLGRKKTLVATLLIMGLATVTVGLVPTTVAIGAAAPLILTTMRLLQGFAVGGEWAGSALLSAEYAPASKRGWYGMFTVVGGGIALVLTSLTFLGVNYTIGESSPTFMQWGWRIPFLVSAALIAVALYVRFNIDETPVFARERADEKNPFGPSRNADCPSTAAAAARDSLGRRQRRLLLRLRLPGQHLLGQLRSNPTGVFARQHPVRQCAGWTAVHRVHRAFFRSLRPTRAPPRPIGRVGGGSTLVAVGHAADRLRQPQFVRGGCRRHVCHRRIRFRTHGIVHPRTVCY